jgi:putative hydrolase of the HAD superfamily
MSIGYIFFDCMETLIDLHKLPAAEDYAMWAYKSSGAESLWQDFDSFFSYYTAARQELCASLPPHTESELRGQFFKILQISAPQLDQSRCEHVADMLYRNYWRNYKAGCYVKEEVKSALKHLSTSCRMGVVSNFRVMGGIEELLEMLDIRKYFSFVVTSISLGIRKPHLDIYNEAVKLSGTTADRIVFVGDDYINDYMTPAFIGMKAVFYDRYGRHPEADPRFDDFSELPRILSGYL